MTSRILFRSDEQIAADESAALVTPSERDRYIVHVHELSEMSNIARDTSYEMKLIRSRDRGVNAKRTDEQYERIRRSMFVSRCEEIGINPTAYINGISLTQAMNVIRSEINSFVYAAQQ